MPTMNELARRLAALETAEVAARVPEPRPVVIADRIGETEAQARERLGIDAGERILFCGVEDASRR